MKRLLEIEGFGVVLCLGRLKVALTQVYLRLSHSHQYFGTKIGAVEKLKPNLVL
jgi:hypothetical protein